MTNIDTQGAPVTKPLSFHSNPDGFLCEGTPITDSAGNPLFEPTSFTTAAGKPVDRPMCEQYSTWDANNTDSYDVTLLVDGEGYVAADCQLGQIGPLRNCGFKKQSMNTSCTPGSATKVHCTVPAGSSPQVARICDYSVVLKTGIPCTQQDSLATATIDTAGEDVTFTCPTACDANERSGKYSVYAAPLYSDDAAQTVTCL